MKSMILILMMIFATLALNTAKAEEPPGCFWEDTQVVEDRFVYLDTATVIKYNIERIPVGTVIKKMSWPAPIKSRVICGFSVRSLETREHIEDVTSGSSLSLADGFSDVYKVPGVDGIGVRLTAGVVSNFPKFAHYVNELEGGMRPGLTAPSQVTLEIVRVAGKPKTDSTMFGTMGYSGSLLSDVARTVSATIRIPITVGIKDGSFFEGCAGVESLKVPMNSILIDELGKKETPFNLDVLCTGGTPGVALPVKVYFEGDSGGRLNLSPGGAQGVEISLHNDRGVALPFSQGNALDMSWVQSEPKGELYRLPVVAKCIRPANTPS
ncbi:hypothetical protein V8U11_05870 [Pseudomonas chlororaphis]|uniref:hypothetical protein n=1 Tax=Pseudomonas chlororaphis TaxID=587753 RepID=UPI0030CD17EA